MGILIGALKLSDSPEETFTVTILNAVYVFRQLWNTAGFWTIDISEESGTAIVQGVKLISGIDILSQYPSLFFDLLIDSPIDPTRNNIGSFTIGVYSK